MWIDDVMKLLAADALLLEMEIEQKIEIDTEKIFLYNKSAD